MVTIRLARAAISSWLNSAATSWYACAGTWVSASSVTASGFAQGLALRCQVLRERGARTIAMEASGHPGHRHLCRGPRAPPGGTGPALRGPGRSPERVAAVDDQHGPGDKR